MFFHGFCPPLFPAVTHCPVSSSAEDDYNFKLFIKFVLRNLLIIRLDSASSTIETDVTGTFLGVTAPWPGTFSPGCSMLVSGDCPLVAGESLTYKNKLVIESEWPALSSFHLHLNWSMNNLNRTGHCDRHLENPKRHWRISCLHQSASEFGLSSFPFRHCDYNHASSASYSPNLIFLNHYIKICLNYHQIWTRFYLFTITWFYSIRIVRFVTF